MEHRGFEGSGAILYETVLTDTTIYWFKPTECSTPGANPSGNVDFL
jgi:hypothetical protein